MRHKYETRALVLARTSVGEANTLVTLLTPELGLIRARAQGLRKSGAKLAPALVTLAESEVRLVRGKEQWRLAGAVLSEAWATRLPRAARERAGRLVALVLRLVAGETCEPALFDTLTGYLRVAADEAHADEAEVLAAARIMRALGLAEESAPGAPEDFSLAFLEAIRKERSRYVALVNRGIAASGL